MLSIRVRNDGVLAVDHHAADAVSAQVEGLHLRHALLEIGLSTVGPRELLLVRRVGDRLEAGVVVRERAAVARALDVVLPPHRVDAGALAPDVAGHEGQVAEALDVVDAADVLGDAQRVVDGAPVGSPVEQRGPLDVLGRDLADL